MYPSKMLRELIFLATCLSFTTAAFHPGLYTGIGPVIFPDGAPSECHGIDNVIVPWKGEPTLIRKVKNGALFHIETSTTKLSIIHVRGTPYEMGYAHGELLANEMKDTLDTFIKHLISEEEAILPKIRTSWLKKAEDFLVNQTINELLDLTYDTISVFSNKSAPYWEEEFRGLSDASGVDIVELRRMHALPELVKAGCSMVGAWGAAVEGEELYQLRALDWDTDGGLQRHPLVIVYHPNKGNGHAFSILTWPGMIGGLTGLAISEIGADIPFGQESRVGYSFYFLLRDILQFDEKREDALKRMETSYRTCSIWVGVGDRNELAFNITQYSQSTCKTLDDVTVAKVAPNRMVREGCSGECIDNYFAENVAYWGIHLGCWQEEIAKYKKNMNAENLIRMVGRVETGNLHAAVYDHREFKMYVANAKPLPNVGIGGEDGGLNAYDQQFIELDMPDLFKYAP